MTRLNTDIGMPFQQLDFIPDPDPFALPTTIDDEWLRMLGLDAPLVPDVGWTLPEPEQDLNWLLNTHAPTTPLFNFSAVRVAGAGISPAQSADHQSLGSAHGAPPEFRDNQPDNSPWVSFAQEYS